MTHVVIGAGLSGLVAAVELASQGREVLVLEASGALGGAPRPTARRASRSTSGRTRCTRAPSVSSRSWA